MNQFYPVLFYNLQSVRLLLIFERFFDRIMSMTAKSSVDSIRREMIADMLIPLPLLKEQHAIASVLSDMGAEIHALDRSREKAGQIKQGMMQQLLSGRVRLVESGAAETAQ